MPLYSVLDPPPVAFLILLSLLLSPNAGIYHNLHLFICNLSKATSKHGGPANSGWRWSYSKLQWVVGENHGPPFHAAKQVLSDFREKFIADMDANTVVWELLYKDIIPRGVQERISRTDERKQQNEILHDWFQRICTKEALMNVCDIIVAVRGHPKMQKCGEAMKRRLHAGKCVVCWCVGGR